VARHRIGSYGGNLRHINADDQLPTHSHYHHCAMSSTTLAALERRRLEFGPEAASTKLALLKQLARARLGGARAVMRLHEALCFMRAYPDNATLLAQVQRMLVRFASRADLRAHRAALAGSGIAGTAIHYRFFAGQAQWLAQHWPDKLRLVEEPGGLRCPGCGSHYALAARLHSGRKVRSPVLVGKEQTRAVQAEITRRLRLPQPGAR